MVPQLLEKRQPLPSWVQDEPPLVRGDELYLRGFWELSSCRQFGGQVVGPIPWDKIMGYGERKGLDPEMLGVFCDVVRELDEAYLSWQVQEQKQRSAREERRSEKWER